MLKCASHCFDFSIIDNFESMQTINNKRKYKLQQLFKIQPLSLDIGLESFPPLVSGPVKDDQLEVSQLDRGFSSGRVLASCIVYTHSCMVLLLPWNRAGGTQPVSNFSNGIDPQLNADAFYEKSFITGLL